LSHPLKAVRRLERDFQRAAFTMSRAANIAVKAARENQLLSRRRREEL
jgi:hypothetical protein